MPDTDGRHSNLWAIAPEFQLLAPSARRVLYRQVRAFKCDDLRRLVHCRRQERLCRDLWLTATTTPLSRVRHIEQVKYSGGRFQHINDTVTNSTLLIKQILLVVLGTGESHNQRFQRLIASLVFLAFIIFTPIHLLISK